MIKAADARVDEHPIRLAQRRIADAFERVIPPAEEEGSRVLACLLPIAEAVRWQGTPRQIAEAMPHEMPVDDVTALRTVLHRIGISTEKAGITCKDLREDHCPCLIFQDERSLVLLKTIGAGNEAQIFDSEAGDWRIVKRDSLYGDVHVVRLKDAHLQNEELQRDGFIWPLLRKSSGQLSLILWQSMAINAFGLASSMYVMYVYDKAIGTKSLDTLVMLFIGVIATVALELWIRQKRGKAIARLGARFDALAATGAFQSVLNLPLLMSEGSPLSAQLARFKQFQVGRELFGGSLATSILDLPFTIIFFAMMFVFGGALAFIPVAFAVLLAVVGLITGPSLMKGNRDMGEWKGKSDSVLIEVCSRLKSIRADNAEDVWLQRATDSYKNYLTSKFHSQQYSNSLQVIAQAGVSISGSLVLGLGAVEVMHGTLSLGALVALMAVLWRVLGPMQVVFLSSHRIKTTVSTIRQIDRLIKMKGEREPGRDFGGGISFSGRLSLSGVCFRYPNRAELAIRGVSFEIGKGELVAITGPSGAGKSTIMKVMMGLYQAQSGSVRLDEFDIRQLDPVELRQTLSFMAQEPVMFYGTVAQNLRLVAPDATDEELLTALAAVGISSSDPALPDGLKTRFNARNRRAMSHSFFQRLAVAQAFLRNSPVLFLDEPANHLDREGDEALRNIISRAKGKRTIIMTTARPSHMKMADRIIVMNDGVVAAMGRPEEILPSLLAQTTRAAG